MSKFVYLVVWEEWSLTQVRAVFSNLDEAIKWRDQANKCYDDDLWCIRKVQVFDNATDCVLYRNGDLGNVISNKNYEGEKIK
jgi:hypothetical protein